ncbi:rhodanese-like domain-containing protein [Anaerotignum sp.]|uniref:rhodanese-like domain-containing protein n=1 Tax=Anaerotignum sp. TaxID=2039241 RepID=UPI0028AB0084|nr:rhodanese-like domain-containing protein [Anaerotignum sp.]
MKKQSILIMALCGMIWLSGCSGTEISYTKDSSSEAEGSSTVQDSKNTASYQQITAEEAKKMMDDGNVTVVDVRTEEEYTKEHIPNAVLVPVDSIGDDAPEALPDLDGVLLVYCRSGNRSKTASERLKNIGYTNVYEFGGIIDWVYETETGGE